MYLQHGDKCIEFMTDLNVKRLGDLSSIRRARRDALVVRNTVILFPPFSHSFCSIIEKLKVQGLSGHISHIKGFKSSLKFCPPQGWEDDLGKMSLYRFSKLRVVNQSKVLTERGKLLFCIFSISRSLT